MTAELSSSRMPWAYACGRERIVFHALDQDDAIWDDAAHGCPGGYSFER